MYEIHLLIFSPVSTTIYFLTSYLNKISREDISRSSRTQKKITMSALEVYLRNKIHRLNFIEDHHFDLDHSLFD